MKKLYTLLCLICFQFLFSQNASFSNTKILVSFNDTKQINDVNSIMNIASLNFLFSELDIEKIKLLDKAYSKSKTLNNRPILLVFPNAINISETIDKLKTSNLFTYVEPDYISYVSGKKTTITKPINNQLVSTLSYNSNSTTPNDTYFSRQWSLHNDGTFPLSPATADADIDMIEAWDLTTGNANATIAVMDTGLRMNHPELAGRLSENTGETLDGNDTDNNSYVDDINGWDFVNNDNDPTDDHGHGTNVTGIATATGNNNLGYAGVDWSCKVLPLKVLGSDGSGSNSNIIESFYYAVAQGVDVISISIGGSGFSSAYETAVNTAYNNGIVVVACMMNFNNDTPYYPAAFANTIAVGSTDSNDQRTEPFFWDVNSGSNYGSHIDVIAPGNYMYGLSYSSDTNYNSYWGGTSQATPLVSGICSLMLSLNPSLTPDQMRDILRNTAQDQVGDSQDTVGWDQYYGAGRVNAFDALNTLLSLTENNLSQIKIYPNPVQDDLHISSNVFSNYAIFNVLGQKIKQSEILNNKISLSTIESGVYLITLKTIEGNSVTRKIIKE